MLIVFFENNSYLDVMSSVVKLMMDEIFTRVHSYHIIRDWSNEFYFLKYYFIFVHNKTIFKKINMQRVLDEIWYIFEYFTVNIISILVVFD